MSNNNQSKDNLNWRGKISNLLPAPIVSFFKKYVDDERTRFYLLLTIFNMMLLFIILLLAINREAVTRYEDVEATRIVQVTRIKEVDIIITRLIETIEASETTESPTPSGPPTLTPIPTSTPTFTPSPIPTITPTNTNTTTVTNTPTSIPTITSSVIPSTTPSPTPSVTPFPTPSVTATPPTPRSTTPTLTAVPLPPPIIQAISPNTMMQNEAGDPFPIEITGSNFMDGVTAQLGPVPVTILEITNNRIDGTISSSIPAIQYDLTVTNPDSQSSTLLNAFKVTSTNNPNTTLGRSRLIIFGQQNGFGAGDTDHAQIIFFDIPASFNDQVWIRIYDPDTGGSLDEPHNGWNTSTTFSIYGGAGAYTNPDARTVQPSPQGFTSGTLLSEMTFSEDNNLNSSWYSFGPFNSSDGETVNGRYIFKLVVRGSVTGDDGNGYNATISITNTTNTAPVGARAFAFAWTFILEEGAGSVRPSLYPYLGSSVTTYTQYNCDFNFDGGSFVVHTGNRDAMIGSGNVSGIGDCQNSVITPEVNETSKIWEIDFSPLNTPRQFPAVGNGATFWNIDQNGTALAIFAQSETGMPP